MTWIGTSIIFVASIAAVALIHLSIRQSVQRRQLRSDLERQKVPEEEIELRLAEEGSLIPRNAFAMLGILAMVGLFVSLFDQVFFYAEPGYIYHVRTITGEEKVVSDVGYNAHLFGRYNAWKRAMTVQAVAGGSGYQDVKAEEDGVLASASLPAQNIIFLDQVDADAEATARFSIPDDREGFLHMAHEYRAPANLLRTALIPAFKETLQATASQMSAGAYSSG